MTPAIMLIINESVVVSQRALANCLILPSNFFIRLLNHKYTMLTNFNFSKLTVCK